MIRTEGLTLGQLKEDVRSFLGSPNRSIAQIRDEILDPVKTFGRAYVIGGLVRDIAMYGVKERPESDLDLVVRCSPRRLEEFARKCGGTKNRFGGFAVRTSAYRVDFWAFSRTWAKTAGHVHLKTPADLTKTTFFDWDAVVYGITEHKLWTIERYLHRLHSGNLDINLKENPSELGTLVRAIRRLMMWDARPSAKLRAYIDRELQRFDWPQILSAERGAFYTQYLGEFCSRDDFKAAVLEGRSFDNRSFDRRREHKFSEIERTPTHQQPPKVYGHLRLTGMSRRATKRDKAVHVGDLFAKLT
jgi:hypothetical protein